MIEGNKDLEADVALIVAKNPSYTPSDILKALQRKPKHSIGSVSGSGLCSIVADLNLKQRMKGLIESDPFGVCAGAADSLLMYLNNPTIPLDLTNPTVSKMFDSILGTGDKLAEAHPSKKYYITKLEYSKIIRYATNTNYPYKDLTLAQVDSFLPEVA
jgi:hypothetical protein